MQVRIDGGAEKRFRQARRSMCPAEPRTRCGMAPTSPPGRGGSPAPPEGRKAGFARLTRFSGAPRQARPWSRRSTSEPSRNSRTSSASRPRASRPRSRRAGLPAPARRCSWRSGLIRTTSQARPSFSSRVMSARRCRSPTSASPAGRRAGTRGGCGATTRPATGSRARTTFVDWSSISKRRLPKKWQTELIDQVTWWTQEDPHEPAPEKSRQRARERAGQERAEQRTGSQSVSADERQERVVDPAHDRVLEQVGGEPALRRLALGVDEPAHVRVPEALTARRAGPSP